MDNTEANGAYFDGLKVEVRRSLRLRDYQTWFKSYRELLRLLDDFEFSDCQSQRNYGLELDTLNYFLSEELRNALLNLYAHIHFPFEDASDPYTTRRAELIKSTDILKCNYIVQQRIEDFKSLTTRPLIQCESNDPLYLILHEFRKRFDYNFYGDQPTNSKTKPEWFFTQLSTWLAYNMDYFEKFLQKRFLDKIGFRLLPASEIFLDLVVELAAEKVRALLSDEHFLKDKRLFSHLIDETVLFEKELQELYNYDTDTTIETMHLLATKASSAISHKTGVKSTPILKHQKRRHVISEFYRHEHILDQWIRLERDTISAGVASILAEPNAYESCYAGAADVDKYLVPNLADGFVILMQFMFERYRVLPDLAIQCRFMNAQIVTALEFCSKIIDIGAQYPFPWDHPNPVLLNTLWFLTSVLDNWSNLPDLVRLQYFNESGQSPNIAPSDKSVDLLMQTTKLNLSRRTFEECSKLYKGVWNERIVDLCDSFRGILDEKLSAYKQEEWRAWPTPQPIDLTPSFAEFLSKCSDLLNWINKNISPDSVRKLHHLTNKEVWCLIHEIILRTDYNQRGAAQMTYDVMNGLVPLLNICYRNKDKIDKIEDDFQAVLEEECVNVLNVLRLLSLPTPIVLLLREELEYRGRITEQSLKELLEPHGIVIDSAGEKPNYLTSERVLEIFSQRSDLDY